MILRINAIGKVNAPVFSLKNYKNHDTKLQYEADKNTEINGVPRSYVTFRGDDKTLNYSEDAKLLLNHAKEVAEGYRHSEILPQHILQAAIEDTKDNMAQFDDAIFDTGVIETVSPLNKIADDYAKFKFMEKKSGRNYFKSILENLKEENLNYLSQVPEAESEPEDLHLAPDFEEMLKGVGKSVHNNIDSHVLLGSAMNSISYSNIMYVSDFLKSAMSYAYYKSTEDVKKNYMKVYDSRAIDVWNKLALGANLIIAYKDPQEADRITASIVKTINHPKYGSFNDKNTRIYVMQDNISAEAAHQELEQLKTIEPDIKKIVMLKMDNLIVNSVNKEDDNLLLFLGQMVGSTDDNLKIILFQSDDVFYKIKNEPVFESIFGNMVTYSIPPIQTYEARGLLNKKMLSDVKTPFTKEAKDRAIYHAANLSGIFPDKAVDLMKRISAYYGESKTKIMPQDVDEFAQIGYELFNNKSGKSNIIYDTGKTLNSLYGKETTKKDVEAIIRQIKTGKAGTKGIIISSKDNEAGSGRKFTAETIAGEAKVPFISIDTSDFAVAERDIAGEVVESPKNLMKRIFSEAKNAARQNQYKTAIIYVNNFEEFAFSGPYLPGYKQAMTTLSNEMEKARDEDISIIVIGSTDEYYANFIPQMIRGFNQSLSVDTPAFNNKARKETLENRINEVGLPLQYKKAEEKEYLIKKLVKLTEYMSFVEIKSLIDKTLQIMYERNKQKASIGEFIEAYLQLTTGRTSRPEMPEFSKQVITSHECGHATNLEVMNDILKRKGKPWHQSRNVNFITLDPRGDFLGAVFEDSADNNTYPFEAMFTALVCSYGGYSCEKFFFNINGSAGISQDLAQATAAVKRGVEYFGFGHNTGQISNAVKIQSPAFYEAAYKDMDVILTNAKAASDLITETYKKFNEWFTQKYSKLIGTDDCMVDGDEFRRILSNWKNSLSADIKEEINIMEDMVMDIIENSKKGIKYGKLKNLKVIKKAVK